MKITMFQMGFGESILLRQERSGLLVDCGSESKHRQLYYKLVKQDRDKLDACDALVSHFHDDHINGFEALLNKTANNFGRVYIPHIFTATKNQDREINPVDFLIMEYLLKNRLYPYRSAYYLWDFLMALVKRRESIVLLRRGSRFSLAGQAFEVLWPEPLQLGDNELYKCLCELNPAFTKTLVAIHHLSQPICEAASALQEDYNDNVRPALKEALETLKNNLSKLYSDFIDELHEKCCDLTERQMAEMIKSAYEKVHKYANDLSVVFQTAETEDAVLLTGDVSADIMERISQNADNLAAPLKTHYYAIKIPHHGTKSAYYNFANGRTIRHLLISNGETTRAPKRGRIYHKYIYSTNSYQLSCVNIEKERCECAKPSRTANLHCDPVSCCKAKLRIDI